MAVLRGLRANLGCQHGLRIICFQQVVDGERISGPTVADGMEPWITYAGLVDVFRRYARASHTFLCKLVGASLA